jgi:glutathione S-transferase
VVAAFGFGVVGAAAATLLVLVSGIVARSRRFVTPIDASAIELHTITYSHYVEKVRWCLDRTGVAYTEVPSIGILGILLTGRTVPLLLLPASRTSISDSPEILRFLWGRYSAERPECVRFLAPTAEAVALEKHFDYALGVNVRLWSYWQLLEHRDLTLLMWGIEEQRIPQWQRTLLPVFHPVLAALLRRMIGVTDANAAAGIAATRQVFDEVGRTLADGRRYLLAGEEPTFVDITFASLAALILFPEGYGGDAVSLRQLPVDLLPAAWRDEVETLRATPAGQFALRLYAQERSRRLSAG